MSDRLTPPNATPLEEALDDAAAARTALPARISDIWSPELCPAPFLEFLAWTMSVDFWDVNWPEGTKRELIAAAYEVHRAKGTPASIRRFMEAVGYGVVAIIEGAQPFYYDGSVLYDGSETYGQALDETYPPPLIYDGSATYDGSRVYGSYMHWATYRVVVDRPVSLAQADQIRALLARIAPARCHLVELRFTEAAFLYDGAVLYDGTYSYGAA